MKIQIGQNSAHSLVALLPKMANRHGLIAGATGTGKTVTLQLLAEQFSRLGIPVFLADVKGDLSGLSTPGIRSEKLSARLQRLQITDWEGRGSPTVFWDIFRKNGIPLRTTVSEVGPLLLARLLSLNELQEDVLQVLFKVADDNGLLLLDLKDLKALLEWSQSHADDLRGSYGNIAPASASAIQRALVAFEASGGELLFGEPALNLTHLMQIDFSGQGVISILDASSLLSNPRVYSTLLLWLLSELFERLPEVGDLEKPRLVFFFDEAHLLFSDAPAPLRQKIEQVVKLIRSKGVSIFFVTQNPADIPESVLAQLGNRIQHALRAYTPGERKAVRAAAEAFRPNPAFSAEQVITELGVGEALVSTLDEAGVPSVVERTLICPPQSLIGSIPDIERAALYERSPLASVYTQEIDRESAFEVLMKRANAVAPESVSQSTDGVARQKGGILGDLFGTAQPSPPQGSSGRSNSGQSGGDRTKTSTTGKRQGYFESLTKSVLRSVGSALGREVMRGVLGSMRR